MARKPPENINPYDVYGNKDFYWYCTTTPEDHKKIPFVKLMEFENKTDLLTQKMLYISKANWAADAIHGQTTFADVYKDLYTVVPTGRNFRLPYFGQYPFSLTTNYSPIDMKATDSLGEQIASFRTNVLNSLKGIGDFWDKTKDAFKTEATITKQLRDSVHGIQKTGINGYNRRFGVTEGAQTIKSWTSANTGQYETSFVLINDTPQRTKTHYKFIRAFMRALAPSYPNTMMVQVPYVYEIQIPSVLHIPLGFIGNFTATPKGASYIDENGLIIPEAWEIKTTFNSLFPISTQLLDTIDDPYGTLYGLSDKSDPAQNNRAANWRMDDTTTALGGAPVNYLRLPD